MPVDCKLQYYNYLLVNTDNDRQNCSKTDFNNLMHVMHIVMDINVLHLNTELLNLLLICLLAPCLDIKGNTFCHSLQYVFVSLQL